ncbi:SDR family oxidoreductase [Cellulosimicrobium cellulans]|uniref:SDR family oxidoreductase n=1 Tax=Cellulosimicrobium cellulans TaxID=1710 RepID=UPI0016526A51|nr:SDR family oxidoreductase [Cellulosimicrobium cellulans]
MISTGSSTAAGPSARAPRPTRRELAGGVALVTGGTRGIGAAVVAALVGRGMSVAALGRDVCPGGPAGLRRCYPCDVGDEDQVRGTITDVRHDLGRIDLLVLSAGVASAGDAAVADTPAAEWERLLRTNVLGLHLVARAALPELRRTHGQVVTVLSTGAHRVRPGAVAYGASKHAARALTEGLALEEPLVRVSSVSPAQTDTSIWDARSAPPHPATRARMLRAEDVAAAVVWLAERPDHVHVPDLRIQPRHDPSTPGPTVEEPS